MKFRGSGRKMSPLFGSSLSERTLYVMFITVCGASGSIRSGHGFPRSVQLGDESDAELS
jgi:hypothetical protein